MWRDQVSSEVIIKIVVKESLPDLYVTALKTIFRPKFKISVFDLHVKSGVTQS